MTRVIRSRRICASTYYLAILTFVAVACVAKAADPTLSETLAWIDSTYNPHDDKGGAWGHGREEWANDGKPFHRDTETLKVEGCQLTLTTTDDLTVSRFAAFKFVRTLDLKDIDPHSVELTTYDSQHGGLGCARFPALKLTCDMATIDFETYNQRPLITSAVTELFPKPKNRANAAPTVSHTFVATIVLDDLNYANRFLKAFRHVISLCGGKPSPF